VLNIALAYFLVNYSDVNCIVNKAAATFPSFPIIIIKCVGAEGKRGQGTESQSWRLKFLASRMKGPMVDAQAGTRGR
jgi:hypothetical protein